MANSGQGYGQKVAKLVLGDVNQSDAEKAAIAVSQSILEGNWAKLDTLLDKDFTYTGDGLHFTKDQYIGFMQDMRSSFSDFEMVLEKTITDGEFVALRFTSNVVNTGSFMGSPANQKQLAVTGIFMRKVQEGKVMQEWQTTDLLGTMTQIGFGATFGYAVFVTGFKVKQAAPVRKPDDFLHVDGKVENYDRLTPRQKNQYVKQYLKRMKG